MEEEVKHGDKVYVPIHHQFSVNVCNSEDCKGRKIIILTEIGNGSWYQQLGNKKAGRLHCPYCKARMQ